MTRARAAIVCSVGAVLLLAALPSAAEEEAPKRRTYVVAAMGDSLSDPKVHGGKYLRRLGEKCPKSTFDTYAKGGQMVNQMRKRFVRDVFGDGKPKYTHVLVLGGVNDLISDETANRTVEKIEKDLTHMYEAAKTRGAKVVAMTVTPWGGFSKFWSPKRKETTKELNDWIRGRKDHGVQVVDTWALLGGEDPDFLCEGCGMKDGLHWTTKANDKVADKLKDDVFSDCE